MPESAMPATLPAPPNAAAGPRPRPGRRRARGVAATVLGLTLLAAGAAGCSSGGGDQKSGGGSTAAPTRITVPAKIGTLTMVDKDHVGMGVGGQGIPKAVRKNLHDVTYFVDPHDAGSPHVNVRGGPGMPYPSDGPTDKIKRLFSEWDLSLDLDKVFTVPAGSVGGLAECTTTPVDKTYFGCGWISGKLALVIDFNSYNRDNVTTLLPKILKAMVTS